MGATAIDEAKLEAFMGKALGDMGAIISAPLMVIGEKLGLYRDGRRRPADLTAGRRAGRSRRAIRARVARKPGRRRVCQLRRRHRHVHAPDEHALALADEDSPFYILGVFESIASLYADEDKILEAFRTGEGFGWHEHDHRLFRGTERFFRSGLPARIW